MTPEQFLDSKDMVGTKLFTDVLTEYASIVSAEKDKEMAELKQTIEQLRLELSVADDRLMGFK